MISSQIVFGTVRCNSLKNCSNNKDSVQAFKIVGRYTGNLHITVFLRDLTATENGTIS